MTSMTQIPGNITSVGAFVRRGDSVLLVRLTYGPTKGQYSLPGGWQDVGEEIDKAPVREVREETQVDARCIGVIGLRVRTEGGRSITDLVWLLEHVGGEAVPDEGEADDARFMPFDEIERRDDIEDLVKYLVQRARDGSLNPQCLIGRNVDGTPESEIPAEEWKLFV